MVLSNISLGFFVWILLFLPSQGALVNVTVDDTLPDSRTGRTIEYVPAAGWNSGVNCQGCTAHPDESLLFRHTWHDSTFNPLPGSNAFPNQTLSASFRFNGTAVYVFCVLARTTSSPTGDSDMTFKIDGDVVGSFVKQAPGTTGYDYNVTVYSNASLPPGLHEITIQNGHVNGPKALVMLDSIVYTYDDGTGSASSSPSKSTPVIIGSVVASVSLVVIAALAFWVYRRHQHSTLNSSPGSNVEAFPGHLSGYPSVLAKPEHPLSNEMGSGSSIAEGSSYGLYNIDPNPRYPRSLVSAHSSPPSASYRHGVAGYTTGGPSKAERLALILGAHRPSDSQGQYELPHMQPGPSTRPAAPDAPPPAYVVDMSSETNGSDGGSTGASGFLRDHKSHPEIHPL